MKLKNLSYLLFPVLLGAGATMHAQDPMSLYFMESIPQASRVNPAQRPRANVFIALPSINFSFRSDLAVKDIFQQHGDKWYLPIEKQYDYGKLYKSIGRKATMFNTSVETGLWGFGFRTGKGYLTFSLSEHAVAAFALPSDLFKIPESGFPDNTTMDFSPMRIHAMAYKQLLVGYSRAINDKLTIGVNLKPIFGQVALTSDIRKFSLYTGISEWKFDIEGDLYSSLPVTMTEDEDGKIKDVETQDDLEAGDYVKKYALFANPGFAIDLGASYKFTDRLSVSAALDNLGFISWKQDLNGAAVQGQYAFNGINYNTAEDDFDEMMENLADSLENSVSFGVHHKKFKTTLTPSLYLGASYRLTPAISVSLLSRSMFWKKAFRQNFNLSLNLQPYSFVSFNIGVNTQIKGNTYFGTGFSLFLGPLQFYLLSDYLPVRYSTLTLDNNDKIPFVPERQKEVTFRTGLNLVFGKHGYVNRPMLERQAH
ncbi:MAG: DUF5723 family protein [Bacteroidales bacterium]|jgi:hypothetical protein|nr:DUF5723 family protein [Bacteroidales bacterium]